MIYNPDDQAKTIRIQSLDPAQTMAVEPIYAPTRHPEWLTFEQAEMSLAGKAEKPLVMFLEIPDQPENKDTKIYFIAELSTGNGPVVQGKRYLRIMVDTSQPRPASETKMDTKSQPNTNK